MKRITTVDEYIDSVENWGDELRQLRKILNETELEETVKWGAPCYTYRGKNLIGLRAFKTYFALWFFQGALLEDDAHVLISAQQVKTKALRQWRMEAKSDIKTRLIKSYVKQGILLQAQDKEIKPSRGQPIVIPVQLAEALTADQNAKAAFQKLSKGKQREYADHVADAKREETKRKRIEKVLPMICQGKGLHDKYRRG